jgi:replicative DNA helicase Mcm
VRSQSSQNGPIGVKHRHLEGLIRMAEASAKLHMRDEVTVWDAKKAIELMTLSLTAFGFDKETGKVDVDKIYTGISSSQRNKIGIIKKIIEKLDDGKRKKIQVDEIIMDASNKGIHEDKTVDIIEKLKTTGDIMRVDRKHILKI